MKITYSYHGIPFEWDSGKATENLKQHEVSFETACEALLDPFVRLVDIEDYEGEVREITKPERKLYEEQ